MTYSIALLVIGVGLILLGLGLLKSIRMKDYFEATTDSQPRVSKVLRMATLALGILLMLASFVFYIWDKQSPSNNTGSAIVSTPLASPVPGNTTAPSATPLTTPTLPQPELLIVIIKREQRDNVRESYGKLRGQNFSEEDLADFVKAGKVADIKERLKTDAEFLDVVLAIKRMPSSDRQKLLNKASRTYKQTWLQRGKIDREGQTDAGQKVERMIAEAIVDLVKESMKLSDEAIGKLRAG